MKLNFSHFPPIIIN